MNIQPGEIGHIIQLSIAPVFLLTGVGTNMLVLTNRLARIIDRTRALEEKLETLIQQYNTVKDENRSLKVKQEELVREKAKLMEKSSLIKARIEAMIVRLKAMEHGS